MSQQQQEQQSFELAPLAAGVHVPLLPEQSVVLGRVHYDITDARISRQHVTVQCTADGVTVTAQKAVYVQSSGTPIVRLIQPKQHALVHVGDTLYLLKAGGSYTAGFRVQQLPAQQPAAAAAAAAARAGEGRSPKPAKAAEGSESTIATDEPTFKRHKSSSAAAATAAAAQGNLASPTSTYPAVGSVHNRSADPTAAGGSIEASAGSAAVGSSGLATFSHTIAAAAQAGSPSSVKQPSPVQLQQTVPKQPPQQQQQQQQQLFAGLQLVDWDGHHTHLALQKAAAEGAVVSQTLDPTTTHVVARHELSAAEVTRRLQAQSQKQQRQQRHSPAAKRMLPQQKHSQQQQQQGSQDASVSQTSVSKLLPPGVQFVTVTWITSCLRARQRLPEAPYYIDLQHQLQRSQSGAHARLPSPAAAAAAAASTGATDDSAKDAAGAGAAASDGGEGSPTSQQQQQQQLDQESLEKVQRRAQKQQFVVPGPDEICPPDVAWGTGNRWIEPWDDAAALDAMEQIMAHWHQTTAKHPKTTSPAAAGAATATPGSIHSGGGSRGPKNRPSDTEHEQTVPFQQQQQQPMDGSAGGSAPCEHVACSRQAVCLVEEMERLKRNYHGRADQFRIKAASRAILELERLQQPIVTAEDIELLGVGEKSKQKLQEILATGRLRQNDLLESSELHRTMQLFMKVWGCADSTARKWWAEGCRSLNDVRNKATGLTAIQQMGLKYYDDFEQRIHRDEVTEAVTIIRDTVLDVLQDLTGKARSDLDYLLHVRALGSYVRGKLDTGDIDMLMAPGPAAEDVPPGPLAAGLLQRLKNAGYVPEGLSLDHRGHSLETAVRVSWMGVWKGPSSPCYRRLDIKTYQRPALPYAVNYFSSGQDCSRAIRYWCNKPRPEVAALAAAIHPAANAFHMSDTGLYVVYNPQLAAAHSPGKRKQPRTSASTAEPVDDTAAGAAAAAGGSDDDSMSAALAADIHVVTADSHSPTGPEGRVNCSRETDIFRVLGLPYVPPHLRSWY